LLGREALGYEAAGRHLNGSGCGRVRGVARRLSRLRLVVRRGRLGAQKILEKSRCNSCTTPRCPAAPQQLSEWVTEPIDRDFLQAKSKSERPEIFNSRSSVQLYV
jgi:hypothetical protein